MKKVVLIMYVMIIFIGTLSSQPIAKHTAIVNESNYFTEQEARYTHITMENTTDEDYYFWIGRDETANQDANTLIQKYFSYPDKINLGDMTLGYLPGEYVIHVGLVGFEFIKLLKPHEKFEVIIRGGGKKKTKFYEERFVFMPFDAVDNTIGSLDEFLYVPNALVLE